ncbi:MAG: glgX [Spirosoma sp.]|nr:glgX [Spirosoma sp.]
MIQRIISSPDIYGQRGPTASINFVTCHDGFSLYDMFAYDQKHNEANGEDNNDGANDNNSWNCGWEGETDDPAINFLRHKQVKNALAILLVSQGVPMILMGDEVGKTQKGNNNTYCQDNDLNWFNWVQKETNADLFNFARRMIHFRRQHPVLRSQLFFQYWDSVGSGLPDISFHGTKAWNCDRSPGSRSFAFLLDGDHAKQGIVKDNTMYVAINMYWEGLHFELPVLPSETKWYLFANTDMPSPGDIYEPGSEVLLSNQSEFLVGSRSIVILIRK